MQSPTSIVTGGAGTEQVIEQSSASLRIIQDARRPFLKNQIRLRQPLDRRRIRLILTVPHDTHRHVRHKHVAYADRHQPIYPPNKHVHRLAIHPTDTSEGATIRTLNELAILGNAITGKRHRPKDPIRTHDHKATDPERTPQELWVDP